MKKTLFFGLCSIGIGIATSTQVKADIYKSMDANGQVTYSNIASPGAKRLNIGPEPSKTSSPAGNQKTRSKAATPSDFPRVDRQTQNQRDGMRRKILQDELANENSALTEAKKAYSDNALAPISYRGEQGGVFPNAAKSDKNVSALQAEINNHQRNILLLKKELDAMKAPR